MTRRIIFLAVFLPIAALAADKSVVWEPARMLDAEQVVESGAFIPLPLPTVFSDFRYPFLQEDESVVFIANDDSGSRGCHGIYRISKDGKVSKLAEVGDRFTPDGCMLTYFSGLRVAGGRAVFRCDLDDGSRGIGMWENGQLTLLARSGGTSGFEDLGFPGLSDQAVTFLAHRAGEVGELYAVDLTSFPRLPRKIADTSTPIPGSAGKLFGSFGFQEDADGDNAIFRGFAAGAREILRQPGNDASALGGVYRKNIRTADPPVKIVDTATVMPDVPGGATFAELQNAIPRDGTVVIPSWSSNHEGIYYVGRDGKPRLVADTATQIPDLFTGTFSGFNKWAANCAPWVIFRGYAENDYQGLFAMHMERGELFLLIDNKTELGGKKVSGFELSCTPKLGEDLVLAVEFTDESSGVYLFQFGDGRGQSVFRQEGEEPASDRTKKPENVDVAEDVLSADTGAPPLASASAPVTAELVEEGSFRMLGDGNIYGAPEAATGIAHEFDEAELLERGNVFAACKGLSFGYRYNLHSPGGDRCHVEGFDMLITHPPIKGPDGHLRTTSVVPLDVCFNGGKSDEFLIYSLEEDHEVVPGQWTLQVRKDGQVLITRSFALL